MKTNLGAVLAFVALAAGASSATLEEVPARGRLVEKRWKIDGDPRGIAIAADGTIYVGLATPQSVVAIDPSKGAIVREAKLGEPELASTKDFATLRIAHGRLYIAQGSDESATILSLPDLGVIREIGLEGERVRDALPDPAGRHLYVLGRTVHVFDALGTRELRELEGVDPLALATDTKGRVLAVVGYETFPNGRVTMAVFYDARSLREIGRLPLQTDREIVSAFFAAEDRVLVVAARDWLAEAPAAPREEKRPQGDAGAMRLSLEFGDLISSEAVCLPDGAGPQIAAAEGKALVVLAEKRCAAGGSFTASKRQTRAASLYGIAAYALARTPAGKWAVTDPAGFLTIYRQPQPKE
ncbi:MAG: YncE family protein [Thermoanaerobaculia bacterium]